MIAGVQQQLLLLLSFAAACHGSTTCNANSTASVKISEDKCPGGCCIKKTFGQVCGSEEECANKKKAFEFVVPLAIAFACFLLVQARRRCRGTGAAEANAQMLQGQMPQEQIAAGVQIQQRMQQVRASRPDTQHLTSQQVQGQV